MIAIPETILSLRLCLYVAGPLRQSSQTLVALDELRRLGFAFELEIVDIEADPQRAENDRLIATPTLARMHPLPVRRVMGDLSDVSRLLQLLQIS